MPSFVVDVASSTDREKAWASSPHATIFTHPEVLKRIADEVHWFAAKKGDELFCVWPVCVDRNGKVCIPPFTYYVGPMWTPKGLDVPNHRVLKTRLGVYENFISVFEREFGGISCQLPLGIEDVRPFDWWNYSDEGKNRFAISPRYTAVIEGLSDLAETQKSYRFVRRYEVRQVKKSQHYAVSTEATPSEIVDLYNNTIVRQGGVVESGSEAAIVSILSLASDGFGEVTAIRVCSTNELAYAAVTLSGRGVSNLVLNVAAEEHRGTGVPAFGVHNSIAKAIARGDTAFDFNGANSPRRGDDKHSYGASPRLYFELHYQG